MTDQNKMPDEIWVQRDPTWRSVGGAWSDFAKGHATRYIRADAAPLSDERAKAMAMEAGSWFDRKDLTLDQREAEVAKLFLAASRPDANLVTIEAFDTTDFRQFLGEVSPEIGWPAYVFDVLARMTKICEAVEAAQEARKIHER